MKVLLINSICNGSTGHIVQDIAKDYISQGHECVIAYGRGNPPKNINSYKIGNKVSVYWHVFITRLFDKHGFGSKYATKKFIKWIKKYKPDLVWLHNIHGYYININLLFWFLKESNINVKWTLHDCWSFTGHCAYFDYAKCYKWKKQCEHCPSKRDYPAALLSNSYKNYNKKKEIFNCLNKEQLTIITPSYWLSNLVKESFLKKYKTDVINNKIDINIFKPLLSDIKEKNGIINKRVILGVASVWDRRKGLVDFINLSKKISDDFKIVLIGLSDKQLKGLPNNILGIKRTENQIELVKWYSAADCFFLPTYEDNYPTVLLEANACGCDTYSYDAGGCKEIAKHIVKNVDDFINKFINKGE